MWLLEKMTELECRELLLQPVFISQVIIKLMVIPTIQLIGLMLQTMQVAQLLKIIAGELIIRLIVLSQIFHQIVGQMLMEFHKNFIQVGSHQMKLLLMPILLLWTISKITVSSFMLYQTPLLLQMLTSKLHYQNYFQILRRLG